MQVNNNWTQFELATLAMLAQNDAWQQLLPGRKNEEIFEKLNEVFRTLNRTSDSTLESRKIEQIVDHNSTISPEDLLKNMGNENDYVDTMINAELAKCYQAQNPVSQPAMSYIPPVFAPSFLVPYIFNNCVFPATVPAHQQQTVININNCSAPQILSQSVNVSHSSQSTSQEWDDYVDKMLDL